MRLAPKNTRLHFAGHGSTRRTAARPAPGGAVEGLERRQLLSLPNGGVETGDLSGWANPQTQYGIVATNVTSHHGVDGTTYGAVEGGHFALLPAGYGGRPTSLSKDFHAEPGDTIHGWAFYDAGGTPEVDRDETARVAIKAGTTTV